MSGHTHTHNNYSNPRCAHARRGLIIIIFLRTMFSVCFMNKYNKNTKNSILCRGCVIYVDIAF